MKKSIFLIICLCLFKIGFAQIDNKTNYVISKDTLAIAQDSIHKIIDASYRGSINNFYNYVGNNYNYHNLKSSDILDEFEDNDIMTIYLKFYINEEGKPVNFESLNTTPENTFYKEAIRVISSTKWNPATKDGIPIIQEFRIPIQAYIRDFIN